MVDNDDIAERVFALLKGYNLQLTIFDENGTEITDPSLARRFFSLKPNLMVTIDPDDNTLQINKGGNTEIDFDKLQKTLKKLANQYLMNFDIKIFNRSIQPKDYSYQVKNKGSVMENEVRPVNHHLIGKIMRLIKNWGGPISEADLISEIEIGDLSEIRPLLNRLVKEGKLHGTRDHTGNVVYSAPVEDALLEDVGNIRVHNLKGLDPEEAYDATQTNDDINEGDLLLVDGGIALMYKAWPVMIYGEFPEFHQFKNLENFLNNNSQYKPAIDKAREIYDQETHNGSDSLTESFSRMFGSLFTSKQIIENVRILVKHKKPVDESVRGSRSRSIAQIFLECNGERFRFPSTYLPGARAMARHMSYGGNMNDKVGNYIIESIEHLQKLNTFNRYVTSNKLINEDSSGILSIVIENIAHIKDELKKITSSKTYETVKSRIETETKEAINEADISDLKELFTVKRFDEKLNDILPVIKQMVQEKESYMHQIEEAATKEIHISNTPFDSSLILEFTNENSRFGYRLNELAQRITGNAELSKFITEVGSKCMKDKEITEFEKNIVKNVLENITVEKKDKKSSELKESKEIETFFDKYNYTFL